MSVFDKLFRRKKERVEQGEFINNENKSSLQVENLVHGFALSVVPHENYVITPKEGDPDVKSRGYIEVKVQSTGENPSYPADRSPKIFRLNDAYNEPDYSADKNVFNFELGRGGQWQGIRLVSKFQGCAVSREESPFSDTVELEAIGWHQGDQSTFSQSEPVAQNALSLFKRRRGGLVIDM